MYGCRIDSSAVNMNLHRHQGAGAKRDTHDVRPGVALARQEQGPRREAREHLHQVREEADLDVRRSTFSVSGREGRGG